MNKAFITLIFTFALLEVIYTIPLTAKDVHSALQIGTFDSNSITGKTVYAVKKNVSISYIFNPLS